MRSVHTLRSTHPHRAWASPACLGKAGLAPLLSTAAGSCSFAGSFTLPLSCVPSLHGHYPLHRYYGRSDFLRRLFGPLPGMNSVLFREEVHCLSRHRFMPFRLQSSDARVRAFHLSLCFLSARHAGFWPRSLTASIMELGPPLKVSRSNSTLTRHIQPNRVHCRGLMAPRVTDWHFAFSCSPRPDFAAAVSFRYRPG